MKKFSLLKQSFSLIIISLLFSGVVYAQASKLDPLLQKYFTKKQKDTMSVVFIETQNSITRYSWNIYRQWDKGRDTIVQFKRDTIDIRKFLRNRDEFKPVLIYNEYPGLVIELDSWANVKELVRRVQANNKILK